MFTLALPRFSTTVLLGLCLFLSSCSGMVSSVLQPAIGNLQQQTDIDLICEGAPAYLLMVDSLLVSSPKNRGLLLAGVQSYSAYVTALKECGTADDTRLVPIADKAKLYGQRLLSRYLPITNGRVQQGFEKKLAKIGKGDLPQVFWGSFGWLTWVKAQQGSPEAIADMVYIEKIMARLLEIDESYQGGSIHLFFAGYHAAKPKMFGGRPDLSQMHFEKALQLSNRRFLLTQTTYAETLGRATLDRELHDRLLNEVVNFPLDSAPEFGLSNQIAVNRAKRLLEENYFGE